MKLRNVIRFTRKTLLHYPIVSILVLLVLAYICATLIVMVAMCKHFSEAALLCLPAFLGELGVLEVSPVANVAIIFSLFISIAFLAVLTAKITSVFVEICRQGGSIVNSVQFSDHIIICGWNIQGPTVVAELISSGIAPHNEIVILADCERRPIKDERVEFVRGDPSQDKDLKRAGILKADSVIVLSDLTKTANEADAESLMIVLAVETLNRAAHTCVQILNAANRIHLERAHADEIICLDQLGGNLVVASSVNHGISRVVRDLLTFNSGSEFYRLDVRSFPNIVGMEFSEAVTYLAKKRMLLVGFETTYTEDLKRKLPNDITQSFEENRRFIVVNPQDEYKIRQDDAVFVIAKNKPEEL